MKLTRRNLFGAVAGAAAATTAKPEALGIMHPAYFRMPDGSTIPFRTVSDVKVTGDNILVLRIYVGRENGVKMYEDRTYHGVDCDAFFSARRKFISKRIRQWAAQVQPWPNGGGRTR